MATRREVAPNPEDLWATTSVDGYPVRLYKYSKPASYWGFTICHAAAPALVFVHESLLKKGKEKQLHAVLHHEFIHVCESVFFRELSRANPWGCTVFGEVFGDRIPELFNNIERLRVRELAAVKDAVARRKDGNKRKRRKA
jgi:hypothetical protein